MPSQKALTGEDFHDPTKTGPRATHNIPNGGLFSCYSSAKINAPPKVVYDAILDVVDYPKWNTFVYEVQITKTNNPHEKSAGSHKRLAGGTCFMVHRNITYDPPEQVMARQVVTLVEKLKVSSEGHSSPCITRIRWSLDNAAASLPGFVVKRECINEIEEAHDGTTMYRCWEAFAGVGAKFVRKKFELPWRDRLQEQTRDLKKWCEEKAGTAPKEEGAKAVNGEGKSEGTAGGEDKPAQKAS